MEDDIPFVDQRSMIQYIHAALDMDGTHLDHTMIERVLELELEYLQHQGIAERVVDDPRPE